VLAAAPGESGHGARPREASRARTRRATMKDLSPELAQLVGGARGADDPSAADRERVHEALAARVAAGAGAGASPDGSSKLGWIGRGALVLALLAGLATLGVWWSRREPPR